MGYGCQVNHKTTQRVLYLAVILVSDFCFLLRWTGRQSEEASHRIPDEDVDVHGERVVEVLGDVQVNVVTEVVVHVHSWK